MPPKEKFAPSAVTRPIAVECPPPSTAAAQFLAIMRIDPRLPHWARQDFRARVQVFEPKGGGGGGVRGVVGWLGGWGGKKLGGGGWGGGGGDYGWGGVLGVVGKNKQKKKDKRGVLIVPPTPSLDIVYLLRGFSVIPSPCQVGRPAVLRAGFFCPPYRRRAARACKLAGRETREFSLDIDRRGHFWCDRCALQKIHQAHSPYRSWPRCQARLGHSLTSSPRSHSNAKLPHPSTLGCVIEHVLALLWIDVDPAQTIMKGGTIGQ